MRSLTSIIVPVHDAPAETRKCLESVRRHTRAPYELIVVDDASARATARYLDSLDGIALIRHGRNQGFPKAVNAGMRAARGDSLVWLNSDAIVTPSWLDLMLDCARGDRRIGAVGPVTNNTPGPQAVVTLPESFSPTPKNLDLFAAAWTLRHRGARLAAHRLTGFCLLVKRAAAESVGLLDERFGKGYAEDLDYGLRLIQAGHRLAIAGDAFVYHKGQASFGTGRSSALDEKARRLFVEKWCRLSLGFLDRFNGDLKEAPRPFQPLTKRRS
ncbi:MAG: glycosyltransferase family 2 protein [Elusimicrobiota bacterium]